MAKKRTIYKSRAGKRLPSVTGITGILHKPALMFWVAKMACQQMEQSFEAGRAYMQEEISAMLEEARRAHMTKRDDAKDFGTEVHELLEAYIEGQDVSRIDGTLETVLDNFKTVTKGWEWHGTEMVVTNEEIGYGGTADGIAVINGRVVLVDFKTSGSVYPEHDLQVTMYAHAVPEDKKLQDMWKEIDHAVIVHLNKETLAWQVVERDIHVHVPYISAFKKVYDWNKEFSS